MRKDRGYERRMKDNDDVPRTQGIKWLEGMSQGRFGSDIDTRCLRGLQVVTAEKGRILCNFVVPNSLSDGDGNWHTGAIFTLMDDLSAAVIATVNGENNLSVNFNVSYLSTVKTEEEVEIEGKLLSHKGKLASVLVEVRRKNSKEVVVFGKQWMSAFTTKSKL